MTLYLSGAVDVRLHRPGFGFMLTPRMGQGPPLGSVWAADTGCYRHPDTFDGGRYLAWLRTMPSGGLFATAPDVWGDWQETIKRAAVWADRIRAVVPVALCLQDGACDVPWDDFDCAFIGGSDGWRHSSGAGRLYREAREQGKWLHLGRCNSYKRLTWARELGFDSADGTKLAYGRDIHLPAVLRWAEYQMPLGLEW